MNRKSLGNLPPEIIHDEILSRLPVRTVIICKCVCKSWLDLINTPEFANSHVCKSVPGLIAYQPHRSSDLFKIFDLEQYELLRYSPVTKFNPDEFINNQSRRSVRMQGSVNGLLFLLESTLPNTHYICNPITRDYIKLPSIQYYPGVVTYGFGVSKISYQYKVVRIFHECVYDPLTYSLIGIPKSTCQVYTFGTTCSWRTIAPGAPLKYSSRYPGVFLKGNLHWLVADLKGCLSISCLNLETEVFSTFGATPMSLGGLVVLGDCLCLCDNTSNDEIVIWIMKEYGVKESWTKEFVIGKAPDLDIASEKYKIVYPMKVFGDGDILMSWNDFYLFCYSNETKTTAKVHLFERRMSTSIESMLHTSSFVSLKSFAMENVSSF